MLVLPALSDSSNLDQAWEFKHPEFQANKKDALDNIKRKAPAPRRATTQTIPDDPSPPHIDILNAQLISTQAHVQQLQDQVSEMTTANSLLLKEVYDLQRLVKNHDGVMKKVLEYLKGGSTERRSSLGAGSPAQLHASSPLPAALQMLEEISTENLPNMELQNHNIRSLRRAYSTPDQSTSAPLTARSDASTSNRAFLNTDLDSMVYPVGQTTGIDPINRDHINNIPYALPESAMVTMDPMMPIAQNAPAPVLAKRPEGRANVLLVEDDPMCAKIGAKFLEYYNCECTHAVSFAGCFSRRC